MLVSQNQQPAQLDSPLKIIDDLFDAANQNNSPQIIQILNERVNDVTKFLNTLTQEESIKFSKKIVKIIDRHAVKELEQLAIFIARNTSNEYGKGINFIYDLLSTIAKNLDCTDALHEIPESKTKSEIPAKEQIFKISAIAYIFSASINYIHIENAKKTKNPSSTNNPLYIYDIAQPIFAIFGNNFKVSKRNLYSLRCCSRDHQEWVDLTLIDLLKNGKISFSYLKLCSVDASVKFFGPLCSEFSSLDFSSMPVTTDVLEKFPNVQKLTLDTCSFQILNNSRTEVKNLSQLKQLQILNSRTGTELNFALQCQNLKVLDLTNCLGITTLNKLNKLTKLKKLIVISYNLDISDLPKCTTLNELELTTRDCKLEFLSKCTSIRQLGLNIYDAKIDNYNFLPVNLESLRLYNNNTSRISSLPPKLSNLRLFCSDAENMQALRLLTGLRNLSITSRKISNLNDFENLQQLESLSIYQSPSIDNINMLSKLTNLKALELYRLENLSDLNALGECSNLETVKISSINMYPSSFMNKGTTDISFLLNLSNLKIVKLETISTSSISKEQVEALRKKGVKVKVTV